VIQKFFGDLKLRFFGMLSSEENNIEEIYVMGQGVAPTAPALVAAVAQH
jgi:hypothetical protein